MASFRNKNDGKKGNGGIRLKSRRTFLSWLLVTAMLCSLLPVSASRVMASSKMRLNKKKVTLTVGKKKQLKVKHLPKKAKVKWISKKKKIASVSKKGMVSARKKGKTVIVCKIRYQKKRITLKCRITVRTKTTSPSQTPTTPGSAGGAEDNSTDPIDIPQTGMTKGVPAQYQTEAARQGQVVRMDYESEDYVRDGKAITKTAYVYTPYGYDENDTDTRYNIL